MNVGIVKTASYLASTVFLAGVAYVAYDYYTDGRNRAYFDLKRADSVLNNVKSQLVSLSVQPDGRWREDEATAPAIEGVSVSAVDAEP